MSHAIRTWTIALTGIPERAVMGRLVLLGGDTAVPVPVNPLWHRLDRSEWETEELFLATC